MKPAAIRCCAKAKNAFMLQLAAYEPRHKAVERQLGGEDENVSPLLRRGSDQRWLGSLPFSGHGAGDEAQRHRRGGEEDGSCLRREGKTRGLENEHCRSGRR